MSFELLLSQLTDPFRLGLLAALLFTMFRTRATTGTVLPLVAGIIFVAVIIPSTMGDGNRQAMATGIVANAVIVAIALAGMKIYQGTKR